MMKSSSSTESLQNPSTIREVDEVQLRQKLEKEIRKELTHKLKRQSVKTFDTYSDCYQRLRAERKTFREASKNILQNKDAIRLLQFQNSRLLMHVKQLKAEVRVLKKHSMGDIFLRSKGGVKKGFHLLQSKLEPKVHQKKAEKHYENVVENQLNAISMEDMGIRACEASEQRKIDRNEKKKKPFTLGMSDVSSVTSVESDIIINREGDSDSSDFDEIPLDE